MFGSAPSSLNRVPCKPKTALVTVSGIFTQHLEQFGKDIFFFFILATFIAENLGRVSWLSPEHRRALLNDFFTPEGSFSFLSLDYNGVPLKSAGGSIHTTWVLTLNRTLMPRKVRSGNMLQGLKDTRFCFSYHSRVSHDLPT